MTREELYLAWAPEGAAWSDWAKPILFAFASEPAVPQGLSPPPQADDAPWLAHVDRAAAIVIDVAGTSCVRLGLVAAAEGWRPVPLFNGTPGPDPVVEVRPLLDALVNGTAHLPGALAADAPPAFLLDAARMPRGDAPRPDTFDNRWQTFPQDFPSAVRLRARGITRVIVVTERIEDDLAHVLHGWQIGGLAIEKVAPGSTEPPSPVSIKRPSGFGSFVRTVRVALGLRRNSAGGFGAIVPDPAGRRGGFG